MPDARLFATAAIGLASAASFAWVAAAHLRRPLPRDHRLAGRAFAWSWMGASAVALLNAVALLADNAQVLSPGWTLAFGWANVVMGLLMLAGVMAYLAYLLTGNRFAVPMVGVVYAAQLAALVHVLLRLEPSAAIATGWTLQFQFGEGQTAPWIPLVFLAPALLASACYLGMIAKAEDPTTRWRIGLVGGGLTMWSGAAILVRMADSPDAFVFARLAGAILAICAVMAYAPPTWARERWAIRSIHGELPRVPPTPAQIEARRIALGRRMRELV